MSGHSGKTTSWHTTYIQQDQPEHLQSLIWFYTVRKNSVHLDQIVSMALSSTLVIYTLRLVFPGAQLNMKFLERQLSCKEVLISKNQN